MTHPLALPKNFSPDALDTTAELAVILSRLEPPPGSNAGAIPGTSSGATPLPHAPPDAAAAAGGVGAELGRGVGIGPGGAPLLAGAGPPIHIRELPTATDLLKHKLKHARTQIKTLPDMHRTTAQQDAETRTLEARIQRQKDVLAQLRAVGGRFAADGAGDH